MIFGLAIGLSVAFAVYVKDREPEVVVAARQQPEPASLRAALDDEGLETSLPDAEEALPKRRFEFYELLPAFEMIIADEEPAVDEDIEPEEY